MLDVEGQSSPIDAARIAGRHDRSAHARGRENAFGTILLDQRAASASIVKRESPGILRRNGRMRNQGWRGWERLRKCSFFLWNIALRNGTFDHIEHRLAGLTIEDEQHAGFGGLHDGGNRFALAIDVDEHRLSGDVVIPEIVMHELLMPHELSG